MIVTKTVTIANGQSLSAALDCRDLAAAGLSFQMSLDGSTFVDLFDESVELVCSAAAANRSVALNSTYPAFIGARYLKIRSGTAGTPVNQGGERTLTLVFAPIVARLSGGREG